MTTVATVKGRVIAELMQETMNLLSALEAENAALREENELLKGDNMPPVLSPSFIAEYCGVSASTVSDWLITGEIKARKVNGRWLILREDFLEWLHGPQARLIRARG